MGLVIEGEKLRRQLAIRGRSVTEFAELAGLSLPTVSHALAGRPLSPATFRAICRALTADAPLPGGTELLATSGVTGASEAVGTPPPGPTAKGGRGVSGTAAPA
ncbi:MAG: helix-turn-helix domain-containing protein [Candidatus Dormibacteria bacterium]